jgi:group I intron endonuclease
MTLPRTPGVYLLTNTVTGVVYVGSAVDLLKRWLTHKSDLVHGKHHNPRLQASWQKHGPEAFTYTVLEMVPDGRNRISLLAAEQRWLDYYRVGTDESTYNAMTVAGSHLGRKRSDETRARLSAAATGRKHSPEVLAKLRAAKLGRKLSPEHIEKIAAKNRGRKLGPMPEWHRQVYRKLLPEQVRELRRLRSEGWIFRSLARRFGISISTTQRICRGESYFSVV